MPAELVGRVRTRSEDNFLAFGKDSPRPPSLPVIEMVAQWVERQTQPPSHTAVMVAEAATHKLMGQSAVLRMSNVCPVHTGLYKPKEPIPANSLTDPHGRGEKSQKSTGNRAVCRVPDLCIPHACHNWVYLCLKTLTGFAYVSSHTGLVSGGTSLLGCEEPFTSGHIWGTL